MTDKVALIESIYRGRLELYLKMANNLCGDYHLSQDLVHESFTRLLGYAGPIESEKHCSILLTTIIKQRWSNMCKSNRIWRKHIEGIKYFIDLSNHSAKPRIEFYPLANKKIADVFKLPDNLKKVIVGGVLQGMGQIELSVIYGVNRKSIPSHRAYAFAKLRRADVAEPNHRSLKLTAH